VADWDPGCDKSQMEKANYVRLIFADPSGTGRFCCNLQGGRKSMSRLACLEILLHTASLHPDVSLGRGVPKAYRAANANRAH